jgi:hypothetical protein
MIAMLRRFLAQIWGEPERKTAAEEKAERRERMTRDALERLSGTAHRNERIERALERALEEARREEEERKGNE